MRIPLTSLSWHAVSGAIEVVTAAAAAGALAASPALAASGGWTVEPSPAPSQVSELLAVGATSNTNLWAVGYWFQVSTSKTIALTARWRGSAWQQFTAPSPGWDTQLNGVAVISPADAWTVGFFNTTPGEPTAP